MSNNINYPTTVTHIYSYNQPFGSFVIKSFANIILIITLLFTQASEAFVVSEIPCDQEHLMALDAGQLKTPVHNLKIRAVNLENTESDCCQHDYCCPTGLLSFAVLTDDCFKVDSNFKATPPLTIAPSLQTVILQQHKRPPKPDSIS